MNHAFEKTEAEIRREKAEALGRTGERLEQALGELAALREELSRHSTEDSSALEGRGAGLPASLQEKVERYARLRDQVRQFRHHLVIQREAIGLRRHEEVDRQFPMPPPLTLSMFGRDEGSS